MESLHYSLMKSHSMLNRRIQAGAQGIGLTSGQPKVLECLMDHEGLDQKSIACYCEIEPATVGSILLRMEQAGLIERRQKGGNRRSLFVYLTAKGRDAANQMESIFQAADAAASTNLSRDEYEQLLYLLGKVCSSLESQRKEVETHE